MGAQVISLASWRQPPAAYSVNDAINRLCGTCRAEPGQVCTGPTGARRIPCVTRLRRPEINAAAPASPTRMQVQA